MGMSMVAVQQLRSYATSPRGADRKYPMESAPQIVALVMAYPRTALELSQASGIGLATVKRWLIAFEAAGVIAADEGLPRHGVAARIWRLNLQRAAS